MHEWILMCVFFYLALLDIPVEESAGFFAGEYGLDYLLATYPKAVVAIMDGITSMFIIKNKVLLKEQKLMAKI